MKLRMKHLKKTLDWALFEKESMTKTLAQYSEWTRRLRQTMSLVLLTLAAFGSSPLGDFSKSKRADEMGLQDVIGRQTLANAHAPENFRALSGNILEDSEMAHNGASMKLVKYDDGWGGVEDVMLEHRDYSRQLRMATDFGLPELESLKAPMRDLAWLLHKASFTDIGLGESAAVSDQLAICTLPCLGYIDQPDDYRTAFLYRLPRVNVLPGSSGITTLHGWINAAEPRAQQPMTKPSLGNRFSLAHTLCLTLFNIHASGWVHKNIWSRGIVIFPSTAQSSPSRPPSFVPYLTGWGLSRLIGEEPTLQAIQQSSLISTDTLSVRGIQNLHSYLSTIYTPWV